MEPNSGQILINLNINNQKYKKLSSNKKNFLLLQPEISLECIFMTDTRKNGELYYEELENERKIYNDIRYQNLKGGAEFAKRLLYHLVFAYINYNFDYMLRAHDDYFVCLENILNELPFPMEPMFHWGYVHTTYKIKRPEEGIIIFSKDLVQTFLHQDFHTIKCHPLADQMIALWASELKLREIFRYDNRLHHKPIVREKPQLRERKKICKHYIGIYGAYADDMRALWKNRGKFYRTNIHGNLLTNSVLIEAFEGFDWSELTDTWKFKPKLCLNDPTWNINLLKVINGTYLGRQDEHRE